MRKLQRIKKNTEFVVIFYNSFSYFLLLLGLLLIFTGYHLNQNFFLKFTIDNKLTESALNKIQNFKIFISLIGVILLVLVLFLKYYKAATLKLISRKKHILQNLILLFITLIILILILELAVRGYLPEESKYNFPPGQLEFYKKYISLNNNGYRDIDHTYEKKSDIVRIVVLGDSYTFGSGIKNVNNTYLKGLEKLFNENSKDKTYEVLNFGKAGVDTEFEIKILKNDALLYKPDIIILGYVLNDFRDHESQKISANSYLFWFDIFLKRYSYLYHFTSKGFNTALEALGLKKSYYQTIIDSFNSESNKKLNSKYFEELKRISKTNNSTLVVVIFPFIYKLDNYPFTEQHRIINQIINENDIIVIDLLLYFQHIDENKIVVSKYDNHPNELGHEIAAKAIYERLIKLKLVA